MSLDIVVPPLGESISEAVIARWHKQVGERAATDEVIAELETDKVTVELRAPAAGTIAEHLYAAGATVKIGEVVGRIETGDGEAAVKKPVGAPVPVAAVVEKTTPIARPVAVAPVAPVAPARPRAVAATWAEAPDALRGRPLPPSVRQALREHPEAAASATAPAPPTPSPSPKLERVVPMSPIRKRIAERLVQAQHTAAILTTFNEVDMSHVMALRERNQETFVKRHNIKLGLMSFFTKAAIAALEETPGLNAEIRGDAIVYKQHYHIGIAVGTGRGLVVPVVRDADRLSFADIERAIAAYGVKARDNKLTLDDLAGGTFTITNGGVFGSMLSTPLLNYPQTGILGMHNIVRRPVAVEGDRVEVRPVMYIALSYDHRVVDGREAVQFLVGVKQRIENPERLLFAL